MRCQVIVLPDLGNNDSGEYNMTNQEEIYKSIKWKRARSYRNKGRQKRTVTSGTGHNNKKRVRM